MCGVVGLFGDNATEDRARLMARALRHRGPDALGAWSDENASIAFGHTRLAIVDLSEAGAQPMRSASGRYVVTYNGELYNAAPLKIELETVFAHIVWRGHSDTEILLAAIEAWGIEAALRKVKGMFALAIWDRHERMLHLARDRLGEKPLYYGWAGSTFVFASELKAIRTLSLFDATFDRDALASYMRFGYVPAPQSIYKNVRKLPAGSILSLGAANARVSHWPEVRRYWSATEVAARGLANPISNEADAVQALDQVLRRAVKSQMSADVPLGAFLSGGVDSSTIVALMQAQSDRPIRTFTVGFTEKDYDESHHAARVAKHLGADHCEVRLSANDALDVIALVPHLYDEPFADCSQLATYLICREARRHVTVALSGDAGDELFGGYNRYFWSRQIWDVAGRAPDFIRRLASACLTSVPIPAWNVIASPARIVRPGDRIHKIAAMLRNSDNLEDVYRTLVTHWPRDSDIVKDSAWTSSLIDDQSIVSVCSSSEERMMLWDTVTYLPDDILVKVDRAAMAASLETRAPFLDPEVMELAWRLPLSMKIRNGRGKWALRQVLYKYVPEEMVERPKTGFAVPVGPWLRGPLRDWAEALLDERRLIDEGFFCASAVRRRWREHLSGLRDWSGQLWAVLMFQAWLEVNGEPNAAQVS